MLDALWVEKYRPSTTKDYVFPNDAIKKAVQEILDTQNLPHLLLSGGAGVGKTALARALVNDLGVDKMDIMFINTSDENSVDVFREKVKSFAQTWPYGDYKVVILDEADFASQSYQAALRNLMEVESDTCRFILTCNYPGKLMEAIRSRCHHWAFPRPAVNDITMRAAKILAAEKIKFDLDTLDSFVSLGYPDTRKIINLVQQYTLNGTLTKPSVDTENSGWMLEVVDLVKQKNFSKIREIVNKNATLDDYDEMFKVLYKSVVEPQAIVHIAEYMYRHTLVSDPEINFSALCEKLGMMK